MADYEAIKSAPLAFLDYFAQWGPKPWQKFIEIGIKTYLGGDLNGKQVLEIGPGYGRMSCLMALLGGQVTALDVKNTEREQALELASNLGVSAQIDFVYYDGNLDIMKGRKFDLIFSKSALIYPDDLKGFLESLEKLLKPTGQVVFIENARGNRFHMFLRWLKRRKKSFFRRTHYFTVNEVNLMKSIFNIELVMHSKMPPIFLFCGKKK